MTNVLKSKFAKASLGVLVGVLALASSASAMTSDAAKAFVDGLGLTGATATALIAALTSSNSTPSTSGSCSYTFDKAPNLKVGSKGEAVKQLQIVLNSDTDTALAVAAGSTGSAGHESTTFGPATKAAVMKFQTKHSITPVSGFVGSITAAALNAACSTPTPNPTPTPTPTGPVSVMLSTDNPFANNVVSGQAAADLAHFTFSGAGTVTGVTLQRTGISANTDIPNVYLYEGVNRVSDSASVNTNGVITFANLNLSVSGATTISVKADIASAAVGTVGVTMTSYTVSGGTTANTVNLVGNQMSCVFASSIASVAVGVVSPSASTTVNAGTMNYSLWSAPVTVSTRTVALKSAAFQVIGSAPTDSLQNVTLYVNGTSVATSKGVNSMGYVSFDLSAAPTTLQTGSSTLEVRADVVKGSSRTVSLALQNAADLMVMDTQLSVNVAATGIPKAAGTVTINAGSITVTTDPTFTATTVTGGVTNVPLARYTFKAYGEDVKISYLDVTAASTGTTAGSTVPNTLDNVALFSNGAQISGTTANYTGTQLHFTLGSSLVIPAGTTVPVEVRADTKAAGANITGGTIQVTLVGYSNNAQGVTSSTLSTVPSTSQVGPSLSVGTGTLALAKTSSFVNQNIVSNTNNQMIGSFTIQAGSSEGVHVTSLTVDMSDVTNTLPVTSLSNMYIKYGTTSSTPINPQSTTNNFSTDITLAANASIVVNVYADVGNGASSISVANSATPTFAQAAVTANNAGTLPSTTVTVGGTFGAGIASVTINGNLVQATNITDNQTTANAIVAAICSDPTVSAQWTAADGAGTCVSTGGNTLVITVARKVGTGGNFTITSAITGGGTLVTAASPTTNYSAPITEVDSLTPGGTLAIGNTFTATYGAVTVTSAPSTLGTLADSINAFVTAWNNTPAALALATASNHAGTSVYLTAHTSGTAITYGSSAGAAGVHSANATIVTKLSMTATGKTSNSTVASSPTSLLGQTLTVTTGSINTPTLTSASPVQQYVIGGTTGQLATYNFVAQNGAAVIDEMDFTVSAAAPLSSLTVNGVTTLVSSSCTSSSTPCALTSLNLSVPISYSGTDVPVTATWNTVGYGAQPSGATASITLVGVKYHVGNTTTTTNGLTVASNTMAAVASYPTVTVAQPSGALLTQSPASSELIDVTVTAPLSGAVKLTSFGINTTQSIGSGGTFSFSTGTSYPFIVKDSSGSIICSGATVGCIATSSNFGSAAGGAATITFGAGTTATAYTIAAGGSQTFHIFAPIATLTAGTTALPNIYANTNIVTGSTFAWSDVAGGVTTPVTTGTNYMVNFPSTVTSSVHN